ncbi:hypothetical protein MPSEU_000541100 [Mayamaea pseudoterrestris]|nr:hypothetical protein MPSEU_000541100 [Mayamaea pseudoterrestris]
MIYSRSFVVPFAIALSLTSANAFMTESRSFVKKTSIAALPDSLDIPAFTSGNVDASPSLESVVSKVASSAVAPAPVESLLSERVPAIPNAVQSINVLDVVASAKAASLPDVSSSAPVLANGLPMELLPIGLGVLAVAAIGAFVVRSGRKDETGTQPPVAPTPAAPAAAPASVTSSADTDISIPYDAAARLAYGSGDEIGFAAFKKKYEEDTVKMVIEKKKARGTGY